MIIINKFCKNYYKKWMIWYKNYGIKLIMTYEKFLLN